MFHLAKLKFNPPKREAFIEDEGDSFQVSLLEDGEQVGGCYLPDDGHGGAFQMAQQIASDWLTYNDRMKAIQEPALH
jgi:hypothetical protein